MIGLVSGRDGTAMSSILPPASAEGRQPVANRVSEDAARMTERDLRLVLDNVPALVKTMTASGAIDFANRRLLDYLGVELDQLQDWLEFVHESDRSMMLERLKQALESGQPYQAQCRLRRADGVYRWFEGSALPVRGTDGAVVRWYYLITDIEDRKRAEDLLRSTERQLRAVVDNIPASIAIHGASGELEFENRTAQEYHGRSADEQQQSPASTVHPDDLPALAAAQQRALSTGESLEFEMRLRRADAAYRWFQMRSRRSIDTHDGIARWYTVGTDIHDRKTAEDGLRLSETRLLEVQRLSRTGAWRYDVAADVVESSPEIHRVYAPEPGEDISHPSFWFNRIHPEDRLRVQAQFERCVREKADYQAGYRIVLPDGSIRYQYATGHPVTNDGGDLIEFIGASMDMTEHWLAATERSVAEDALRKSEERWHAVFENSAIGVALTDPSGRFLAANSAYQNMLGYTEEELRTFTFLELTHEDYRESNRQLITELLAGTRRQFQIEKQYRRKDGRLIWVSNNVSLVPGTDSMPRFLMALSEDITERKQTEEALRKTQAALAQVTRAASLGEMTASIAHEVNQPLAAVVANGHACLRWLSGSPPNVPKAIEAAERIVKDGKDAGEVVRRVRALFKRTAVERVQLDLNEVITEVLRLLDSYPARKQVSLNVLSDPELPAVFADRVQLQQLLLNLMVNALEALEPVSGRVKQLSVRSTRAAEHQTVIQISDNGIGLEDVVAAFEPFVTTKPEGMGLGLTICRSIVAAHEGTLSAERNAGFGTTFTVTLPLRPEVSR
jgi:PAS domain S-box-containing protein